MAARGFGERNQLVDLRVTGGRVFERGPDAQCSLLHQRIDECRHARQLLRRWRPIVLPHDGEPHLRRPHERGDVERRALLLELREITVQITPVFAVMPLLHRIGIFPDQLIGKRRNRATLPGDFGGNALGDF